MKFLITNTLHENKLLKLVVLLLTLTLLLFIGLDIILQHQQIGLFPSAILTTLQGDEEAFIEPLLLDVLLEKIHIEIFTSMITLVLITIIYIRIENTNHHKRTHLTFLSAIFTPIMILLTYFYGNPFHILWFITFLLWHFMAFYFCLIILWKLFLK